MILQPSRSKHKKQFKGRLRLKSKAGHAVAFGGFGLVARSSARVDGRQLEAARMAVMKHIKGVGKMWIRVFPNVAVSKKPTEVRMGKGKGEVDKWVFKAGAGRVLLEVGGVSKAVAKAALAAAGFKLNVKTSFVDKADELTC